MFKRAWWLAVGGAILVTTLAAFQMPWRLYTSMEPYDDIPLPPDYEAKTDWVFARLMYPQNTNITFLRSPAAHALQQVQQELNEKGLGLKIFDAYRPYSVTVLFWDLVKDERYVADPAKGSGHNRGIAVDLTIIKRQTGQELDMGTGFDNFTDSAHQDFTNLPEATLQNRNLLKTVMEKYGFKPLDTEWWHFFLADGDRFELLDIDFKELKKEERP